MKRNYPKLISLLLILCLALSVFAFAGADSYAASVKKPKYIAHRGWSSKAPENTLAAFRLAAKNSRFYGVEFDVWEASYPDKTEVIIDEEGNEQTVTVQQDPLLLVMHDDNIKRMCDVSRIIKKISRKTLDKYTIKHGSNISKYKGQKIPTSDQALDTIYSNSKGAIPVIELKERLSKRALRYLLESLNGREAVVISFSFNAVADTVKMARSMGISDNIKTMYLKKKLSSKNYTSMISKLKKAGIDCISLKYTQVSSKTVKSFHKSKIKVCIWTVPNKSTAKKYAKMGVDYITANGAVY